MNKEKHKIITAYDIYKDAKKFSKLPVDNKKMHLLLDAIREITSEKIIKIQDIIQKYDAFKQKELLSKEIILKTPITSLKTIKKGISLTKFKDNIKRIKPKILTGKKFLFYDAGTNSKDFCKTSESCKYCETIASYIDPASRPTEDVLFIDTQDLNVSKSLSEYGIGIKDTNITYNKNFNFTLVFKSNLGKEITLKATIDIKGNLSNIEITPNSIRSHLNNLFKGNLKKNEYINDSKTVHYTSVELLFILCKELGDTYQAIILKELISNSGVNFSMYNITNTCLTTNDTVLFLRSKLLQIPVLLYNDGLVRYYPSAEHKVILRQGLEDEIINVIETNQKTVNVLEKIIIGDFEVKIPHQQYKLNYNDDKVKKHLQDLIDNITIVNKFLEGLQKYIKSNETGVVVPGKVTLSSSLTNIKERHISSINKTYETIISISLENLDEANLQSMKNKINAFKSLFIKEYSNPKKFVINFNTKTIFSNTLILLERDTNLFKIINECCFFRKQANSHGKIFIQFKEWVQINNIITGGVGSSPEYKDPEKMDVLSPHQISKPDSFNNLASAVTYVDIKSFVVLYEHLYIYINCYPKLLYKFLNKDYLKKFIEFDSEKRVIEINHLIKNYFNRADVEFGNLTNEQLYQLNYQTQTTDTDDKVITKFLDNLESLLEENPNLYFNEDNIILGSSRKATTSKSSKRSKKKKGFRLLKVVKKKDSYSKITQTRSKREERRRKPYGKGKTQKKKPIKKKNKTKP